ncbi:MAG: sugar phosphate isomerase/epimerase [Clostridia bacterium]|nr:sugar phosphate isomerase/epimerase [Clostridia bacterium]
MLKLCAFADEASTVFSEQLAALKKHSIPYIELRGLDGKNVSSLTPDEAREYKKQLDEAGIRVWSIGSPIGKMKLSDDFDAHLEKLRATLEIAKIFDTHRIRMFSFYETEGRRDEVFANLRRMVKLADDYGVVLYHENEKDIYGDIADRVLDIRANVAGLRYIFDPANFLEVGQDIPDAQKKLINVTDYFHIKDVIKETRQLVPAGKGNGEIVKMLESIKIDTTLTIEPHLKVFKGYSETSDVTLNSAHVYETNSEAFDAAVAGIKDCLKKAGYVERDGGFVKE